MGLGERKSPSVIPTSELVEDLNDARTLPGERCVLAHRGWAGEKRDFFSILLENQHRIAIAVKAVPLANRLCIGLSKKFGPGQCGDQHQQCGTG
jgi:hypothetical protein